MSIENNGRIIMGAEAFVAKELELESRENEIAEEESESENVRERG